MKNFRDLVKIRRSIRKFQDKRVEIEVVKDILKATLMAPSSKRSQPWQFVVVDENDKLDAMSRCREMGCKFLADAPMAVVVLADESLSDVWVEDASIVAAYMQLAAEDAGLGSCWVQVRNRKTPAGDDTTENYLRDLLSIPEHYRVECIVALGYKAEEKNPFDESKLKWDRLKYNSFDKPLE